MIDTTRHGDLITDIREYLNTPIHIIGCGSIGTSITTLLTRLGFTTFILYDNDTVEEHNIANQYFDHNDLGIQKTTALKNKILLINPDTTIIQRDAWNEHETFAPGDIVISCVDTMRVREELYTSIAGTNTLFLDGRMGAHDAQSHALRTNNTLACEKYYKTLYNDTDAAEVPCTMKTILYTVNILTSIMARRLIMLLHNTNIQYINDHINMEEPTLFRPTFLTSRE